MKNNNGHIEVNFENDEIIEKEFFVPDALLHIVNNNFNEEKRTSKARKTDSKM